jgi:ABC-type branched-subunit amino acid transport system substrate-binding protein
VIVKTVNYKEGGSKELDKCLSKGYTNLVVVLASSEVYVTKIVEFLATRTKEYDIKLFGLPEWEYFQNINLNHLQKQQFHYVTPAYVNYDNWRVQSFITQYREAYKTEPSIYAFEGYDMMYYFGSALKSYGRHFQFCLSPMDKSPNPKGLVLNFDFGRTGQGNGYENNGLFILKYNAEFKLSETQN